MELNASSFYDGEETGKQQLNSTAVDQDENEQKEWKLSPIASEGNGRRPAALRRNAHQNSFKSPLKTINTTDPSSSGYESKNTTEPSTSEPKLSMSAELSSFIANNSLNPFDSILLNSLHKSINFSPRVVFSQESCSQQKAGEKFQWSVEQLAILKPAHISEDEIAASYRSPIPEVEEKIQEALNEYWTKNVSYIPSPDGPRFVNVSNRDGTVTTYRYGEEATTTSSSATSEKATPSLLNLVRKKEAVKAAYATSSPKQRPRKKFRQVRNRTAQTELTIPSSMDLDLKKLLGDNFVYNPEGDEMEEEESFNVSVCSNFSTRRRLFSTSCLRDESDDVANSSILSTDEQMLNESSAQPFNDSLSPVRRSEDVIDETDDQMEQQEDESTTSGATRSHASQIAINISILNDCMMNSIDEVINEEEPEEKGMEEELQSNVFPESHLHENEYELLDRSSSSNATPRHEDLDWTPRRIIGSSGGTGSSANSVSKPAFGCSGAGNRPDFRRFVFDMSPIHPNHNFPSSAVGTPIQRCQLNNLPSGRLNLNDEDEDSDLVEREED